MKIVLIISLVLLSACASREVANELEITEINPTEWTALAKKNMLGLMTTYDLRPYLYTKKINIEPRVIAHSHPVLTLNTRFAEFPEKILSVWLHEEFHWWGEMKAEAVDLAISDFRLLYPTLPPEGGARNEYSTYLHLVVCYLEFRAVSFYLGEVKARELLSEFIKEDKIYPWIYTQILNRTEEIEKIVRNRNLIPPLL